MTRKASARFTWGVAAAALTAVASKYPFNPVRDYLDQLEWDGDPRINDWLTIYLGAERTQYTLNIGSAWFTSAVARVFEPGCRVDRILVLEVPPWDWGVRWDQWVGVLAGPENYASLSTRETPKGLVESLHRHWIMEWDGIADRGRRADRLRGLLTQASDQVQPPYGKVTPNSPRRSMIIGTTNDASRLSDNPEYWLIKVGSIDLDLLETERDQLWAETVYRYKKNAEGWMKFSLFNERQIVWTGTRSDGSRISMQSPF